MDSYASGGNNNTEMEEVRARRKSSNFEEKFDESMRSLEENFSEDSISELEDDDVTLENQEAKKVSTKRKLADTFGEYYHKTSLNTKSQKTESDSTNTDDSDTEVEAINYIATLCSEHKQLQELQEETLFFQPLPLPFTERRRLSECLEVDESAEEEAKAEDKFTDKAPPGKIVKLILNGSDGLDQKKELEKSTGHLKNGDVGKPITPDDVEVRKHKFVVTKALPHADELRKIHPKHNSKTVHFPTSSSTQRPSLQSIFGPPGRPMSPHLDKKFFDVSLVEIRSHTSSGTAIDQDIGSFEDIWIKRPDTRRELESMLADHEFQWQHVRQRRMLKDLMMVCADLSGNLKPFDIAKSLNDARLAELYGQADLELEVGYTPVSIMDRSRAELVPDDQVSFLKVVYLPATQLLSKILPTTQMMYLKTKETLEVWHTIIDERETPFWRPDCSVPKKAPRKKRRCSKKCSF